MKQFTSGLIALFITTTTVLSAEIISIDGSYSECSVYVNKFPLSTNHQGPLITRYDHLVKGAENRIELQITGTSTPKFTYKDSLVSISKDEHVKFMFLSSDTKIQSITESSSNNTCFITITFINHNAPKCVFPWEGSLDITDHDRVTLIDHVVALHSYFKAGEIDEILKAMGNKLQWFSDSTGTSISTYREKVINDISAVVAEKKGVAPLDPNSLIIEQVRNANLVKVSLPDTETIEVDCGDYSYNLTPMYSKVGNDWVLVW